MLGIIYLDSVGIGHSFSEEDLEFFTAFAGMAAVGIENSQLIERMRREAVVLSNFQRYFAPDLARQIAGQRGRSSSAAPSGRWSCSSPTSAASPRCRSG